MYLQTHNVIMSCVQLRCTLTSRLQLATIRNVGTVSTASGKAKLHEMMHRASNTEQ